MIIFIPSYFILILLLTDLYVILLIYVSIVNKKKFQRVLFLILALTVLIVFGFLKVLSFIEIYPSEKGDINIKNNSEHFTTVYYFERHENSYKLWEIFFLFNGSEINKTFDIEGANNFTIAIKDGDKIFKYDSKYQNGKAFVELRNDNMIPSNDNFLESAFNSSLFIIILNYLTNVTTIFIFMMLVLRVYFFFRPYKMISSH